MTVIEVLDKASVENLFAPLSYAAERVIYIGRDRREIERECRVYAALFAARGMQTRVESVVVTPGDGAPEMLAALFHEPDSYLIDLAGGDEVLLFLLGQAVERAKPAQVSLHYGSAPTHRFLSLDGAKPLSPRTKNPSLSVEETVALHGGRVTGSTDVGAQKLPTDGIAALLGDIDAMWRISAADSSAWNRHANILSAFEALGCRRGLSFSLTAQTARREKKENAYRRLCEFLPALAEAGLIEKLRIGGGAVAFAYKNRCVHACLCRAGLLLELKVYLSALLAKNADGSPVFADARTGVVLDWDRRTRDAATVNEVDVILTRGMIPIFISCKNGSVGEDELYKLAAVAHRFGGRFAKKVLAATGLSGNAQRDAYFTRRASEMGIAVWPDVHTLSQEEICALLAAL